MTSCLTVCRCLTSCRHSVREASEQQHLYHCQEKRGRPGHALPVPQAHQWHLDPGRAAYPAGEPQLHGILNTTFPVQM